MEKLIITLIGAVVVALGIGGFAAGFISRSDSAEMAIAGALIVVLGPFARRKMRS